MHTPDARGDDRPPAFADTPTRARRELIGDVVALDPTIDEAIGESSDIRDHSPALQAALQGLFTALPSRRTATVRLDRLGQPAAHGEVHVVLGAVPQELRTVLEDDTPTPWMDAPGPACAASW